MHGAVYGTILLGVIAVAALVVNPLLAVIPILLIAGLLGAMLFGRAAGRVTVSSGPGPDVPSTQQASYDPVRESSRAANVH